MCGALSGAGVSSAKAEETYEAQSSPIAAMLAVPVIH
jgi:hypothetical protein